jgi:hypothetical protein
LRGGSRQFARCPIQARVNQGPVNATLFAPCVRVSTQLAVAYRRRDHRVFGSAPVILKRDKGIWTYDPSKPFGLMVTASQPQVTNCFPAQAGGSQSACPSTKTGARLIGSDFVAGSLRRRRASGRSTGVPPHLTRPQAQLGPETAQRRSPGPTWEWSQRSRTPLHRQVAGSSPVGGANPQVIPEGTGPCQDVGDLRFGLSSTAAHTSRWASGSRLGRSPTA